MMAVDADRHGGRLTIGIPPNRSSWNTGKVPKCHGRRIGTLAYVWPEKASASLLAHFFQPGICDTAE
jgi:hypothetical protein